MYTALYCMSSEKGKDVPKLPSQFVIESIMAFFKVINFQIWKQNQILLL